MTFANRGKVAERLLKNELQARSCSQNAISYRLPDAHAGSFTPTLCDFLLMVSGELFLLECKSVKHAYRLPHGNFGPDQAARMRLWTLAGASAFVLVFHETLAVWRCLPLEVFLQREGGSWDLRPFPVYSLPEALDYIVNHKVLKCNSQS